MTERHVVHGTIEFDHRLKAAPTRVFAAWITEAALLTWSAPGDGWFVGFDQFEGRLGGTDICRFGRKGGDEIYLSISRYEDVIPGQRIVMSNLITANGTRIFVGTVTVELYPDGKGTRMHFTEQGAYLDGSDKPEGHRAGWDAMLESLVRYIDQQ